MSPFLRIRRIGSHELLDPLTAQQIRLTNRCAEGTRLARRHDLGRKVRLPPGPRPMRSIDKGSQQAMLPAMPAGGSESVSSSAKKVLVVDDNTLNLKLVRKILSRERFQVLEASTAWGGIQLAKEASPDLILMDVRLPDLDGLEAVRILKQDPALRHTPILAISAFAMEADIARAEKAGCSGYITKPFRLEGLLQAIRSHLPG